MGTVAAIGSTEVFFSDFFPAAHQHLKQRWPAVWRLVQPEWLAQHCPDHETILSLPGGLQLPLRNPALLPFQLAGVAVGLGALRRLRSPNHTYLRHSLLFFALMNLSSILCHALTSRQSPVWRAALVADVACTGASSLGLILFQLLPPPASQAGAASAGRCCWALLAALLAAAAANLWAQLAWVPEAIYLGTTVAAVVVTSHRLMRRRPRPRLLPYHVLAVQAVALMSMCLPLDPVLCQPAGPWLGTTPLLFLGSDLGFAALVGLAAHGALRSGGAEEKAD